MRSLIFCVALACCGSALADELADANKALGAKAYPQALQLYSKLASGGNAEAQLRLGEMYWYGEGVALDRARGDALFAQAAAGGSPEAAAARSLSAQRAQRSAGIAWWTGGYDGADLTAGAYHCAPPAIAPVSKTNEEIKATNAAIAAWRSCYDAFTAHLDAALPPGKMVPADIAIVMSEAETQQAKAHLDRVYAAVLNKAQAEAKAVMAQRGTWEAATLAFADDQKKLSDARTIESRLLLDQQARNQMNARSFARPLPMPAK
jgi:TPR repeat protein